MSTPSLSSITIPIQRTWNSLANYIYITYTQLHLYTHTNRHWLAAIQTDIHTYIQTDRQIDRQTSRQTDRQTDRPLLTTAFIAYIGDWHQQRMLQGNPSSGQRTPTYQLEAMFTLCQYHRKAVWRITNTCNHEYSVHKHLM